MGDLSKARGISPKERELLGYVKRLTLEPAKTTDLDVEALRKVGWTDDQIFETTFTTALFAFFNRMAEGFGLGYDARGWMPPKTL